MLDCNSNGLLDECDISCGPAMGPCDLTGCGLKCPATIIASRQRQLFFPLLINKTIHRISITFFLVLQQNLWVERCWGFAPDPRIF